MKDLFKKKEFMKMFFASMISRFGDSVDSIAFGYLVYQLTGSKLLLATIFIVNAIPNIVFSSFSGAAVDFYSKKAIIIIGDLARATIVGCAALLFSMGYLETWHLFVMTFLNSTIETFVAPCKAATIPKLVDEDQYLQVNSSVQSIRGMVELVGLGLAGAIIATLGISGAMIIDALTFVLSGLIIMFVKFPHEEKIKMTLSNYTKNYKEGLAYVIKNSSILGLLITAALINFFLTPFNALMPAYVQDVLNMGPEGLSFMAVSISIGSILGGILAGIIGKKVKTKSMIVVSLAAVAVFYMILGLPSYVTAFKSLIIMSIDFALLGAVASIAGVGVGTIIMQDVEEDKRARVGGIAGMFSMTAMPLGAFIAGLFVAFMPLAMMIIIFSFFVLLSTLIPIVTVKHKEQEDIAA